jgi:signal transduction histidine kinase
LFSIADSYFALQNYQVAEAFLKKSLELASKQDSEEVLTKIYFLYSKIAEMQNKNKEALYYLSKHVEIQENLTEQKRQQSLIEMQEKYETERKENRINKQLILIENLNQENEISDLKLQRNKLFAVLLSSIVLISVVFLFIVIKKSRDLKTINSVLNIKNKELAESNATKNKFFSIISHDLSNYAAIMETISSMIIRKKHTMETEILEKNLLSLNKTTASNKNLISNLLQWAVSQDNRINLHPEKINLLNLCNKVADSLNEIAKERNLIIQCNIKPEIHIFADNNTISTVIRNLLSNAIKFAYNDTVIKLEASHTQEQVLISVTDKGIGMSEEVVHELFEKNIQHTKKARKAKEGTGLGLILCKDFVEMNKGSIFVESRLNKGSTFSFTLPIHQNEKNTDNHS